MTHFPAVNNDLEKRAATLLSTNLDKNLSRPAALIDKTIKECSRSFKEKMSLLNTFQKAGMKTYATLSSPLATFSLEKKLKSRVVSQWINGAATHILDGLLAGQIALDTPLLGLETYFILSKLSLIRQAKAELKNREKESNKTEQQNKEIEQIKQWIQQNQQALKSEVEKTTFATLVIFPDTTRTVARLIGYASEKLTKALSIAGPISSFLSTVYKYRKASRNFHTQKQYLSKMECTAQALLQKREKQDKELAETYKASFAKLLREVRSGQSFDDTVALLKKEGIHVNKLPGCEGVKYLDTLKTIMLRYDVQQAMLKQYTDYHLTLSAMTKNLLLDMHNRKHNIEKGFYKLKFALRTGVLISTAIFSGIAIVNAIDSGIITGEVGKWLITMATTGMGALAVVGALLLTSLVYLYIKKPNYIKSYFNLQQAWLAIREIPLTFQNYWLKKHQEYLMEYNRMHDVFNVQLKLVETNAQAAKLREELSKKIAQLEKKRVGEAAKIAKIEKNIENLEVWIKPGKDKIVQAGWKDFAKEYGYKEEMEPLKLLAEKAAYIPEELRKRLGLKMQNVERELRQFFSLDDEELASHIKTL